MLHCLESFGNNLAAKSFSPWLVNEFEKRAIFSNSLKCFPSFDF